MKFRLSSAASAFVLSMAVFLTDALAQVDEIVVTATRRASTILDAPVAVTALSGDLLEEAKISGTESLVNLVPSLTFQASNVPGNQSFQIRGVGTFSQSLGVEPSVSVLVDGVVMGRAGTSFLELIDVERVEVLRGPQGTLFGKNASAGVIQVITQAPTYEFTGKARAQYIEDDEYLLQGTVSGPIVDDKLAARLSLSYKDREGYIDNVFDGSKENGTEDITGRARFAFDPVDTLSFDLAVDYAKINSSGATWTTRSVDTSYTVTPSVPAGVLTPGSPGFEATQAQILAALGPVVPGEDNFQVNNDSDTFTDSETKGISLTADWDVGDHTLTSITAYRDWKQESGIDLDGTPLNTLGDLFSVLALNATFDADTFDFLGVTAETTDLSGDLDYEQFSQELRIVSPEQGPLTYVGGVFYLRQEQEQVSHLAFDFSTLDPFAIVAPTSVAAGAGTIDETIIVENETIALYGEAKYQILDDLAFLLGGRYTHDEVTIENRQSLNASPILLLGAIDEVTPALAGINNGPAENFTRTAKEDNFSVKTGLLYDVADNVSTYFTFTQGYKGPGFGSNGTAANTRAVAPEESLAYEVGLKASLFDNALLLTTALFRTEYDDFQVEFGEVNPGTGQIVFTLQNAAEVVTQGLEVEFLAQPVDDLTLGGGLSLIDSEFEKYPNGPCNGIQTARGDCAGLQDLAGRDLAFSPDWRFNIHGSYRLPLDAIPFDTTVAAFYRAQDDILFEPSQDPNTIQDSYGVLDLSLTLSDKEDRFSVSGFVKNVFDEPYANMIFGQATAICQGCYVQLISKEAQRLFGVELRANW